QSRSGRRAELRGIPRRPGAAQFLAGGGPHVRGSAACARGAGSE
uniref:Uncharacterized protein n=1 Tax=Mandrillus leucophaeus TaxID=9568 RepID=A0A2K5X9L7_MANLE